jgi:hypothetical protein
MIKENFLLVKEQIRKTCLKCGRNPSEIILLGATKTVDPERINQAINLGLSHIGENRIQEAERKFPYLQRVEKHFIGHLQSNKAKLAVELFDMIESIDSLKIARKVNNQAILRKKVMPVLIQVLTDPKKQFGIPPEKIKEFLKEISSFRGLKIQGLFTIGPHYENNPEKSRETYKLIKGLFDQIKSERIPDVEMRYLSMGMSEDFGIAIEEGANIIRIGRALFGERR